jgi:hypothetical protein
MDSMPSQFGSGDPGNGLQGLVHPNDAQPRWINAASLSMAAIISSPPDIEEKGSSALH